MDWLPIVPSGQLLMCLQSRQAVLTRSAANILDFILKAESKKVTTWMIPGTKDPVLLKEIQSLDGWQGKEFPVKMIVLTGEFKGFSAVGAGSNIKERTRVAQLALAVAILVEGSPTLVGSTLARFPGCAPPLLKLASQAYRDRQKALRIQANQQDPEHSTWVDLSTVGFSRACLQDHYFELRQRDNDQISARCYACGEDMTDSHLENPKHQRRLDWNTQSDRKLA